MSQKDYTPQVAFITIASGDDEARKRLNTFFKKISDGGGEITSIDKQLIESNRSLAVTISYNIPDDVDLPPLGGQTSGRGIRAY